MSAPGTPGARALELLAEITPDILRLLGNAPAFGSASIGMTFHDGEITSLDLGATVKRRLKAAR
jgi:hypothetical protein